MEPRDLFGRNLGHHLQRNRAPLRSIPASYQEFAGTYAQQYQHPLQLHQQQPIPPMNVAPRRPATARIPPNFRQYGNNAPKSCCGSAPAAPRQNPEYNAIFENGKSFATSSKITLHAEPRGCCQGARPSCCSSAPKPARQVQQAHPKILSRGCGGNCS